jgi:hypothetical protein
MILLVCSLLLGGCKDIVTPMQNLFVCTDEMEQMHSCSKTGNPDAVYNTYQTYTIGDQTYSVQIDSKGKIVDAIELNK